MNWSYEKNVIGKRNPIIRISKVHKAKILAPFLLSFKPEMLKSIKLLPIYMVETEPRQTQL